MADFITFYGENFEIRKNIRRKKIAVGIDPYGEYFIACPSSCDADQLKILLVKKMDKIINNIEKKYKDKTNKQHHAYNDGEFFLFKGIEYRLAFTDDEKAPPLELSEGIFLIRNDRKRSGYKTFESWYRYSLYNELHCILPKWTKILKVNPCSVNIKTVKSIWGSCSAKGNLTFCTRLALVPPELLEYIIVHELCHMIYMNHSPDFWAEVEKYIPDYRKRKNALNKNGQKYIWW